MTDHDKDEWLTVSAAAHRLGVSDSTVRRLVGNGVLAAESDGRVWVSTTSVTSYVAEEARWITRSQAARIVGCGLGVVARLVAEGRLGTRPVSRGQPSVMREDAEALAPREKNRAPRLEPTRATRSGQR